VILQYECSGDQNGKMRRSQGETAGESENRRGEGENGIYPTEKQGKGGRWHVVKGWSKQGRFTHLRSEDEKRGGWANCLSIFGVSEE